MVVWRVALTAWKLVEMKVASKAVDWAVLMVRLRAVSWVASKAEKTGALLAAQSVVMWVVWMVTRRAELSALQMAVRSADCSVAL